MLKKAIFIAQLLYYTLSDSIASAFQRLRSKLMPESPQVLLNVNGSVMFPNRSLIDMIRKDNTDADKFFLIFTKIADLYGSKVTYAFFVNPIWEKHGVSDPKRFMTQPLEYYDNRFGVHVYQPTVSEILTMYGIDKDSCTLDISRELFDGEPYYIIHRP